MASVRATAPNLEEICKMVVFALYAILSSIINNKFYYLISLNLNEKITNF